MFAGKTEKLLPAAVGILAGQEVVVPCMVDGNPEDLRLRRAKLQRLRAGLKLLDYNPRRDFVGWGGDDFVPALGMPGFNRTATLPHVGPDAQVISCPDVDGDGLPDLCLAGAGRLALFQNAGDSLLELTIPGISGCRAAVWADYNADGRPDLLLATASGPRLLTNLATGFRDDSQLLPRETYYNLTAAAWIDEDSDGRPDILLANGFHGLRLYRNKCRADVPPTAAPGQKPPPALWFEDVSERAGLGAQGIGGQLRGDSLAVCDANSDGRPDFLYGAGAGLLALSIFKGNPAGLDKSFVEVSHCGISFQSGRVGPAFGDFNNDGHPDLFVPHDGRCRLFRNEGRGRFTDVSAMAGDLARPIPGATSAAWGDFDLDGHADLLVGRLRGPNQFFRNRGDGTFENATEAIGLHKRIFNTQAVCLIDLNGDGQLDMVFNNERQNSVVLLGNPSASPCTPVTIQVAGRGGNVGSRVRVFDVQGRLQARQDVGDADGRGQRASIAHFALKPGAYRVQVRYTSGLFREREISVASVPLRAVIDER
jgi:hypothetical protein